MILQSLEIEKIKFIINYDLPDRPETYYSRLALLKELGEAITFVSPDDDTYLSMIERNMKQELQEKIFEDFVPSVLSNNGSKPKKDRKKKPRHRKAKVKKTKEND